MNYIIKNINGIQTVFVPMADANSITVGILVKAGSIYETREINGISHFLEHMFFKGGKKYPTPQIVAETIDEIGGEINAYTGYEYAKYYVKTAPKYIQTSLDLLADMLISAKFASEELEREKGVVIQEIMMYEDLPHRLVLDKWKYFFYGDNSFGWPIIGNIENIKLFDTSKLFQHQNNLYTKDNLIMVIAGKIDNINHLEEMIGNYFQNIPNQKSFPTPNFNHLLPNIHEAYYEKKTEQNHLVIGSNGFKLEQNEKYAANLLGVLLGGNMSSRLFQEIREKKGLCYYIGASHDAQEYNGEFIIRAGIEKERYDFGLQAIYHEIVQVANGNITPEEYNKSLGYMKGKTQMGIETSDEMAHFVGEQYLLQNKIQSLEEILINYEKVKIEDIMQVANKLKSTNLYLYCIK